MGTPESRLHRLRQRGQGNFELAANYDYICLLYTSDAADE